jgi:hypothetical protein
LVSEFLDFIVFGQNSVESIILNGLEFGLVVDFDAVDTYLRVELLGIR